MVNFKNLYKVESYMYSRRERIIEILKEAEKPLTIQEIIERLGEDLDPREVYEDLYHAGKSLIRRSGGKIVITMIVPRCRDCGYEFKDLDKPKKPSKCPRCKSQRIEPPRFYIEEV